jgi:uncharacterized membrane protein YccF (DUF307 family)
VLALEHLVTEIAMCITIIGIPLGVANFKMIPISLFPLGTDIVPSNSPAASEYGRFQGPGTLSAAFDLLPRRAREER